MTSVGLLSVFVGFVVAVQSRLNGQLSETVHNGIEAALASNLVGYLLIWFLVFGMKKERQALKVIFSTWRSGGLRTWELLGGLGGGYYLAMQSTTVPQIGVAIFSIGTIGGTALASLIIDKIGFSPSGKKHITLIRIIGAFLTLLAVTVAVYPQLRHGSFKLLPIILTVTVGAVTAVQQSLNGRVNVVSQRPLSTSWVNFTAGTIALVAATAVDALRGAHFADLPTNPFLYLGGPLGLIFIAISSHVVKELGILNFVLFSTTGQLVGAVLLDWFYPTAKTSVTGYLLAGTAITLFAVALSQYVERRAKNSIPA
jgi:transporter family-2 protein